MGITYSEQEHIFKLDTPNTTYMIGLIDEERFIGHVYYGKKLKDTNLAFWKQMLMGPIPSRKNRDRVSFMDSFPQEYPTHGIGDFRQSALEVKTISGHRAVGITYKNHQIYHGKPKLLGLPATFGKEDSCTTLEIIGEDKHLSLEVVLSYTVFEHVDAIARNVRIKNNSKDSIMLTKALSLSFDLPDKGYEMITLHGSWARERQIERRDIGYGIQGVSSIRGESGHQEHPFLAVVGKNTTEDVGDAYGVNFVYSGNFTALTERNQFDFIRIQMGINPVDFEWELKPTEEFTTPEAIMVYSSEGIGTMSRTFHDLYRNHLIRGEYKDKKRPILINNWEATYFNFTTEKLLDIAKNASRLGIEMLVMDDGWFGKRNNDDCALGDWVVNEEKLSGGLEYLVYEVNKLGMKFGIWVEPEMISPDSELYRNHPDWAIQIPDREPSQCRQQLVLDYSRKEVRDYIYQRISKILHSANIEYVKWDMNRPLCDLGSFTLEAKNQGELNHRYVLGVYEVQDRLISEFPHLLLENCSGGGARFDPGMLYYSPQIWCSDDTDAVERLKIQQGTAMVYPLSCMGAHVSDCPNHTVGRNTPFETRGHVALAGTFGYELDVTKISKEDQDMIPKQIALYHKYNDLVRTGDYYRISSILDDVYRDCYMVVAKDKSEALVTYVQVFARPNFQSHRIYPKGLDPDAKYIWEETDFIQTGEAYMQAGIDITSLWGDYKSMLIHLIRVE